MLRHRGGNRFEGYGNVIVGGEGTLRGWQLTCSACGRKSTVVYRRGPSYPPKILYQMFREKGWKLSGDPGADMCGMCMDKRREQNREDRKDYVKGSVDQLLDLIRRLDLMLASNVSVEYGPYRPQIAHQLKSLFETAYLCNMIDPLSFVNTVGAQLNGEEEEFDDAPVMSDPEPRRTDEATPVELEGGLTASPPVPEPPPAPPPPTPEHKRMNPRTATMLAEMRKAIFKEAH